MNFSEVWENLHKLFDTDNGDYPDIELFELTGHQVEEIFLFLKNQGQDVTRDGAYFWDIFNKQERKLASVDNAASLVVQGLAEEFHTVIGNLNSHGAIIPPLGVFVGQSFLILDYRMGKDWNPENVTALLYLLCKLKKIAPEMQVIPHEATDQGVQEQFQVIWQRFQRENCF
jgi:hypothetical protein